jgi:hypothetical protein
MSQLKVDTITNEAGTGSPSLPNGLTVGGVNYPTSGPLSNRNKIINGAMVIDQRNAGATVTASAAGSYFAVDRTLFFKDSSATFSLQRVSVVAPPNFPNSLGIEVLTAASSTAAQSVVFQHNIEGLNTADLGFGTASAQAVTLSFWVRSSVTGTYCASFRNVAFNRSYVVEYSIAAANTWEFKTITIAGDTAGTWATDTSTGLRVSFDLGSGSDGNATAGAWTASAATRTTNQVNWANTAGATFYITGVQLEAGTVATPFEHRSFGQELALCQRYFTNWVGDSSGIGFRAIGSGYVSVSNVDAAVVIPLSAAMRATPTAAFSGTISLLDGTTNSTVSSVLASYSTSNQSMWLVLRGGTALITGRGVIAYTQNAATNVFSLSAEL